ncbi:MAG: hypothetical protein PWP56_1621 [Acetobacterium sp.]|nr:hypothetical protein [Acetobacterium sp.]
MKKIVLIVLLVLGLAGIYMYSQSGAVTIRANIKELESVESECGFKMEEDGDVTITYQTEEVEGDLKILLLDDSAEVNKSFKSNVKGKEKIHLREGNYTIRLESDGFVGKYYINIKNR